MRLHLFEWEDQIWFPVPLRNAMTAYLKTIYAITPFPKLWAECIAKGRQQGEKIEIVDLGSGSGGPVEEVVRELRLQGLEVTATLTDRYPRKIEIEGVLRYWPEVVDATQVPSTLGGVRTMFASFHHLRPLEAKRILRDAFDNRKSIFIFEATARTPAAIASSLLIPLLVLLMTPRIRPLSWQQILFTYVVPILPLLIFWDGLVSQLRTYTVEELKEF
jgi:hypothetical protein